MYKTLKAETLLAILCFVQMWLLIGTENVNEVFTLTWDFKMQCMMAWGEFREVNDIDIQNFKYCIAQCLVGPAKLHVYLFEFFMRIYEMTIYIKRKWYVFQKSNVW